MSTDTKPPQKEDNIYYDLRPASFPSDLNAVKTLFTEYTSSLNLDLTYQNLSSELSSLPGKYSTTNRGTILLCSMSPTSYPTSSCIVGCAAIRSLPSHPGACELKRFYIVPEARGTGLGRKLLDRVIDEGKGLGYEWMYLDTLGSMETAKGMYRKVGFVETESYYDTPVEETVFMRLDLGRTGSGEDAEGEVEERGKEQLNTAAAGSED